MLSAGVLATGAAALLFAAVFMVGGRVHLRGLVRDRRSMISFSAGMSAAYVFVHVMPEMHDARQAFAESVSVQLRYEGMGIYFLGLIGFLVFYGLDHLRAKLKESESAGTGFKIHVGGFAAYVWMMAYLLRHKFGEPVSTGLYAVAIGFHFLTIDHSLRSEHGSVYERSGRHLLAAMALLGWGTGMLVALPPYVLSLLVAFISGAIIMNSTIMELPSERDGRFLPFVSGGLVFGLILLP